MLMYFLWLSDTNDVPAAPAAAGCGKELPPPGPTNIFLGSSYSRLLVFVVAYGFGPGRNMINNTICQVAYG